MSKQPKPKKQQSKVPLNENTAAIVCQRNFRRRKAKKLFFNRKKAIEEIINTEENYVKDLDVIVDVFCKPIEKKEYMSARQRQAVFGSVMIIQGVNKALLKNLHEAYTQRETVYKQYIDHYKTPNKVKKPHRKPSQGDKKPIPTIGEAFKKVTPFLKIYTSYITNYSQATKTLKECRTAAPQLDQFLKKCKLEDPRCRQLDLTSFLILPIQRIPRYELLLKTLLKYTPPSYIDYVLLKSCLDLIVDVNRHLNERSRQKDALNKVREIQKRLNFSGEDLDAEGSTPRAMTPQAANDKHNNSWGTRLIQPYRHFVREGRLKLAKVCQGTATANLNEPESWPKYECYLFTDMLLFVEENNPQIQKNYDCAALHLCFTSVKRTENPRIIEIQFSVKGQIFECFVPSEAEADEWIRNIEEVADDEFAKLQKTIRESLKMELTYDGVKKFVSLREDSKTLIPKKREEFEKVYNKYNSEFKLQYERENQIYKSLELELQELKKKLETQTEKKNRLEGVVEECVERIRKGAAFLKDHDESLTNGDKILLACLRNDKVSHREYFGDIPPIAETNFDKILQELPVIQPKPPVPQTPRQQSPQLMSQIPPMSPIDFSLADDNDVNSLKSKVEALSIELNSRKKLYDNVVRDRAKLTKDISTLQDDNTKLKKELEDLKDSINNAPKVELPPHMMAAEPAPAPIPVIVENSEDKKKIEVLESLVETMKSMGESTKKQYEHELKVAAEANADLQSKLDQLKQKTEKKRNKIKKERVEKKEIEAELKNTREELSNKENATKSVIDEHKTALEEKEKQLKEAIESNVDLAQRLQQQLDDNMELDKRVQKLLLDNSELIDRLERFEKIQSQKEGSGSAPSIEATPVMDSENDSAVRAKIPHLSLDSFQAPQPQQQGKKNLISDKIQMFKSLESKGPAKIDVPVSNNALPPKPKSARKRGNSLSSEQKSQLLAFNMESRRESLPNIPSNLSETGSQDDSKSIPDSAEDMGTTPTLQALKKAMDETLKGERELNGKLKASNAALMDELQQTRALLDDKTKILDNLMQQVLKSQEKSAMSVGTPV